MNAPSQPLAVTARQLLAEQRAQWPILRENLERVAQTRSRQIEFDEFAITVQFNPGRLFSAKAKLDQKSVGERRCFLCDANRPVEQRAIPVGDGYQLMCNPHPILPEHFTVMQIAHEPQRIAPAFEKMLDVATQLGPDFTVFYNGPECGASAPDHMHFQAGPRGGIPSDREYDHLKQLVGTEGALRVYTRENYLRWFIGLESDDLPSLIAGFRRLYNRFADFSVGDLEPKMNLLAGKTETGWRVILFPRHIHRPSVYFRTDDSRLMLSPGTVDICGLLIIVLEQDYLRVTRDDVVQMYREVTARDEVVRELIRCVMSDA